MEQLVPVDCCTGCAACYVSCPKDAIEMKEGHEGFLYPQVDLDKCNSCTLCLKICPVKNTSKTKVDLRPLLYAGWTNNPDLLDESTSGGVFSEIAENVLREDGVVFGAAYDQNLRVCHQVVETVDDLSRLRGSKYVQSLVGDTYIQAENYLKAGRRVLYSGTPCQIAGLYSALQKKHDALLTCDLLCHGVPSPKVFRMAVSSLENKYNSTVIEILFREKSCGWLHPTVVIKFANGKSLVENPTDNHFNLGFIKSVFHRPACFECPIKPIGSGADITLGDFWELLQYEPSSINKNGTSAIIVNTEKGKHTIENLQGNLSLTEYPFSYIKKKAVYIDLQSGHLDGKHFFLILTIFLLTNWLKSTLNHVIKL